jgi:hypothetical protein
MPEHGYYMLHLRSGYRPLADIPPPPGVETTSIYTLYELEPARALLRELGADPAFLDDIRPEDLLTARERERTPGGIRFYTDRHSS